jgi:hypothetical protein
MLSLHEAAVQQKRETVHGVYVCCGVISLLLVACSCFSLSLRHTGEWVDKVFDPIQSAIGESLEKIVRTYLRASLLTCVFPHMNLRAFQDHEEVNRRRREAYEEFLDATNKKAGLFRDIILEEDYDPLTINRGAVKASTRKVRFGVSVCVSCVVWSSYATPLSGWSIRVWRRKAWSRQAQVRARSRVYKHTHKHIYMSFIKCDTYHT